MKKHILSCVLLLGILSLSAQNKSADTTRFFRLAQELLLTKRLGQTDASVYKEFKRNKTLRLRDSSSLNMHYSFKKVASCPGADSGLATIVTIQKADGVIDYSMVMEMVYYFNNKAAGEQVFNRWSALAQSYSTAIKKMSHITWYGNKHSDHSIGVAYQPSGKGGKLPYLLSVVHSLDTATATTP